MTSEPDAIADGDGVGNVHGNVRMNECLWDEVLRYFVQPQLCPWFCWSSQLLRGAK
jgi:hypothetical protein